MEEKAYLDIRRAQIVCDLPRRAIVKGGGGFGLNDQLAVYNHVESLTGHLLPFVKYRHRDLATDIMATAVEFSCKRGDIDVLKKAEPKRIVDFKESPYD